MTKKLWSINALATELGHDRRKVGYLLSGVQPDGRVASHPAWFLDTALSVLGHKRKAVEGRFDPKWPDAFKASCEKADFVEGMCVMSVMRIVYEAPTHAATMAVHAGADMATAYRPKTLLTVLLMGTAEEALTDMNVKPYCDGAELEWAIPEFLENDWAHLAQVAGEPHDEAAWEAAARKANRDQMVEL